MQYIKVLAITSLLIVKSIIGMGAISVPKQIEDSKENISLQRSQGVGFCLNGQEMTESWMKSPHYTMLQPPVQDRIRGVSFLGSSTDAVSVSFNGVLSRWETAGEPRCVGTISTGQTGVTGLSVSPDGNIIATAAGSFVKLWSTGSYEMRELCSLEHDEQVYSVYCSGSYVAVGGKRGKIWLWHISEDSSYGVSCVKTMVHERLSDRLASLNKIHAIYVIQDGSRLISVLNRSIKVWDCVSGNEVQEIYLDCPALISKVQFASDSEIIACFSNGTLIITHLPEGTMKTIKITDELLASCTPSNDGKYFVTGTRTKSVQLWQCFDILDVRLYCPIQSFMGGGIISQVAFRSDGSAVLIGENTGALRLWSINSSVTEEDVQRYFTNMPS